MLLKLFPWFSVAKQPAVTNWVKPQLVLPKSLGYTVENRAKVYRNDCGNKHRVDGPAIEYSTGTKEWWFDGMRHREGGPAIEWADGTKEWWICNKLVRKESALT